MCRQTFSGHESDINAINSKSASLTCYMSWNYLARKCKKMRFVMTTKRYPTKLDQLLFILN